MGVLWDCQIAWHHLDGPALKEAFGPERMKQSVPFRSKIDAGLLIAGGSDVKATSTTGTMPLMFAAQSGDTRTVTMLLEAGSDVTIHYDPMLAKIIAHAPTRAEAIQRLAKALSDLRVHGVRTNRELLIDVLRHPAFIAGDLDTHFLGTRLVIDSTPRRSGRSS